MCARRGEGGHRRCSSRPWLGLFVSWPSAVAALQVRGARGSPRWRRPLHRSTPVQPKFLTKRGVHPVSTPLNGWPPPFIAARSIWYRRGAETSPTRTLFSCRTAAQRCPPPAVHWRLLSTTRTTPAHRKLDHWHTISITFNHFSKRPNHVCQDHCVSFRARLSGDVGLVPQRGASDGGHWL